MHAEQVIFPAALRPSHELLSAQLRAVVEPTIPTPLSQGGASEFAKFSGATFLQAVGLKFSYSFDNFSVQQRFVSVFSECEVESALEAQKVAQISELLERCFLDALSLRVVHETNSSRKSSSEYNVCVENDHLKRLSLPLKFEANASTAGQGREKSSLGQLQCADGVATAGSFPDAYGHKTFVRTASTSTSRVSEVDGKDAASLPLVAEVESHKASLVAFVMEIKHTTDSLILALAQSFAESTNVALAQARFGVPIELVRVPICVSNGQLMKFAVTCLLQPAFPHLVILSKTLDLSDLQDRAEAALMLVRLSAWRAQPLEFQGALQPNLTLALSAVKYHLKPLTLFFCVHDSLELSLQHFLRVMSRLQASDARSVVVAPLTVVTECPNASGRRSSAALVFPNLSLEQYRIGMPESDSECDELIAAFKEALRRVHEAGVVHLDFYPSNIMWCRRQFDISVRIIDWDQSYSLGAALSQRSREKISANRIALMGLQHAPFEALRAADLVFLDVLRRHRFARELKTAVKDNLDRAFFSLVEQDAAQTALAALQL